MAKKLLLQALTSLILTGGTVAAQESPRPPGGPLSGVSAEQFERFRLGREDFLEVESGDDGLGPTFNGTSCAQCHNIPAVGGTSNIVEIRAGYRDENGTFSEPPGGTLMHLFSVAPHNCQVSIPAVYDKANVIAHRISMPLFGAGLIEAIPDAAIEAFADPDDRDGDGIRGRAALINDVATGQRRVGRFGWKAQQATLLAFAGDAYFNEMGIANDLFHHEGVPAPTETNGVTRQNPCSPVASLEDARDPGTGLRGIDNFENFLRLLAPATRGAITADVLHGERVFADIGCALCHRPLLKTGPSADPVFDRKTVPLFSDLLLHNIGTGDGIAQGAAAPDEIRTPALWGLRFRRPLLHDGTAATLDQAVRRHQGEAVRVTERFIALNKTEREYLLAFLGSL